MQSPPLPLPQGGRHRMLTDQAMGRIAEPIVRVVPFEAPRAERRLLEPIGTADAIETVVRDVVEDLVEALRARPRRAHG